MHYSLLMLQLVVILGTAAALRILLRRIGQPAVVGEMATGLVLGPAVLGVLAPQWFQAVFPAGSMAALNGLAELGLICFMLIVGAELRAPGEAGRLARGASVVALASVALPIGIGLLVARVLYADLAPEGVGFWTFGGFVAAAMSVTAFPVLARILRERGLARSRIGTLSMTAAAIADVLTWLLLTLVVIVAGGRSPTANAAEWLLGAALLAAATIGIARVALPQLLLSGRRATNPTVLTLILIGAFASAHATTLLGLHGVFGAFLFGAALPRDDTLLSALLGRIEHLTMLVLMPIFFALAGLSLSVSAGTGAGLAATTLFVAAAIAAKLVGGTLGARLAGLGWRPAAAVGSLMNTRGLMELVVMKVGLDLGLIGAPVGMLLMITALVTTLMTGPLLTLFRADQDDTGSS